MMTVDSATVSPRAASHSTGNFPIGHSLRSAARSPSSIRLTMFGVNGVPFSYSAISALWQNDESGWKCSVSDMGKCHACICGGAARCAPAVLIEGAVERPGDDRVELPGRQVVGLWPAFGSLETLHGTAAIVAEKPVHT